MQIKSEYSIPTGDELFTTPQRAHADDSRAPKKPETQAKIAGARDAKSKKKN